MSDHRLDLVVNGRTVSETVPARTILADFLRDRLGLTGTHLGCEQGRCGACTVLLDGEPVRSCVVLAVQAAGGIVTTIEGVERGDELHPLQDAFLEHRAFQCGFCTPGMILQCLALVERAQPVTDDEVLAAISGNICRCTGYRPIIAAVRNAAARVAEDATAAGAAAVDAAARAGTPNPGDGA